MTAGQRQPGSRDGRRTPHRRRRGLTLIESVMAVAILALLTAVVVTGMMMVMQQQTRQQRRLACAELCNRLILQYLDDPDSMPDASLAIGYGREQFRWQLDISPVQLASARADRGAELEDRSRMTLDRINAVTLRVWLAETSGGSVGPAPGTPEFSITRMMDPVSSITRNPDSLSYAAKSDQGRARIMGVFAGTERGGVVKAGSGTRGGGAPSQPGARPGAKPGERPEAKPTVRPGQKPSAQPGSGKGNAPRGGGSGGAGGVGSGGGGNSKPQ